MDNVIKPYQESESESSDESSEEEILSSNIGIQYENNDLKNKNDKRVNQLILAFILLLFLMVIFSGYTGGQLVYIHGVGTP